MYWWLSCCSINFSESQLALAIVFRAIFSSSQLWFETNLWAFCRCRFLSINERSEDFYECSDFFFRKNPKICSNLIWCFAVWLLSFLSSVQTHLLIKAGLLQTRKWCEEAWISKVNFNFFHFPAFSQIGLILSQRVNHNLFSTLKELYGLLFLSSNLAS